MQHLLRQDPGQDVEGSASEPLKAPVVMKEFEFEWQSYSPKGPSINRLRTLGFYIGNH